MKEKETKRTLNCAYNNILQNKKDAVFTASFSSFHTIAGQTPASRTDRCSQRSRGETATLPKGTRFGGGAAVRQRKVPGFLSGKRG
ncbi:MAG: hypothetical protein HFF18_14195 [Oscillospiraceae bacterium]|nr:hypothetical protein [Oscillospiraceae bacterium]